MTGPISLIPSEIWSKIFVYAVADSPKVGIDNPRFILTRVSSLWRTVALQTSELWSDIQICSSPSCPESTVIRHASMAKLWLERSGTFIPICLELANYRYSTWATYADLIRPYGARLRRLRISGYVTEILAGRNSKAPGKQTAEYLTVMVNAAMSSGPLSTLEELVIADYTRDRRGGRSRDKTESLDFFAPYLKRLVVFMTYPFTLSQRIFLPQNNQLTHLFLCNTMISFNTWRYIMKECSPRLECAVFWFGDPADTLGCAYEDVTLPRLTSLSLCKSGYLSESCLHGIVCPSLQSFYMSATTLYLDKNFLKIIAPVRRLCIDFEETTIATQEEYGMLFLAAPLLETLIVSIVDNPRNYKAMFDALIPTDIHDVVPRLTSLVVFGVGGMPVDVLPIDRNFIHFLDSRWTGRPLLSEADGTTYRISDVQVHYHELEIQEDARVALENFRNEGLQVVLRGDEQIGLEWDEWLRLELEGMDWGKGIIKGADYDYPEDLRKAMM